MRAEASLLRWEFESEKKPDGRIICYTNEVGFKFVAFPLRHMDFSSQLVVVFARADYMKQKNKQKSNKKKTTNEKENEKSTFVCPSPS